MGELIQFVNVFNDSTAQQITCLKWNNEKFLCTVSYTKYAYGINFVFLLEPDRDKIEYRTRHYGG